MTMSAQLLPKAPHCNMQQNMGSIWKIQYPIRVKEKLVTFFGIGIARLGDKNCFSRDNIEVDDNGTHYL